MNQKTPSSSQDTYVYIDVSNIRSACLKTLGFLVDFTKLLDYLKRKYPNLKEIRYYEGITKGDQKKRQVFNLLAEQGFTICALERKSYNFIRFEEQKIQCPKCKNTWIAKTTKEHRTMKSNVDVYLATDMVSLASKVKNPTHIILLSCDGDYAEAIKTAINLNGNITITVVATPQRNSIKNTLSIRIKNLYQELPLHRFDLSDISTIAGYIT